jgi:undecaprenyl-phosphate 4-deoxy-4-formamido-L-arabinose transferase
MDISVIIPVYNSEKTIKPLVRELCDELSLFAEGKFEIILVNDKSSDESAAVLREIVNVFSKVSAVNLKYNAGQQAASFVGLKRAEGRVIVIMDDDGQHKAEFVKNLVNKVEDGFDLVYAIPLEKPFYKRFKSFLRDALFYCMPGKPAGIKVSSFRAMNKDLKNKIIADKTPYIYLSAMALKHKIKIANLNYPYTPRTIGKSGYNIFKLLKIYGKIIFYYTPFFVFLTTLFKTNQKESEIEIDEVFFHKDHNDFRRF